MSWQVGLYVVAILAPLLAFIVQVAAPRLLGRRGGAYLATAAIGVSLVLSLVGFADYFLIEAAAKAPVDAPSLAWARQVDWVTVGSSLGPQRVLPLTLSIGLRIDNVAAILFVMVALVAAAVHVYSIGYMADDPGLPRYFAFLSLFCFAMLGLLAADNLALIFVFWELVGLCSYLLIGFWNEEKPNTDAANKAFIVNRLGDVGMLVGIGLLWSALGTLDVDAINRGLVGGDGGLNVGVNDVVAMRDPVTHAHVVDPSNGRPRQIPLALLTVAGLGIFAGCVGKSAQFPLNVWLPDAMAGPTPVSALIHAATMVAAGVYLAARFFPIFTEPVRLLIAYGGGITLFLGATVAAVQTDYKKVLAFSTVSQLGFMMLALGVGGRAAALFHLVTHAFFKALLFLGAGSVHHAVHTFEMPVLGGLDRRMKWTSRLMLVGVLAISGVPLLSGFYSKDAILATSIHYVFEGRRYEHLLLFLFPAVGAALTAFSMFRMWFLVFGGEARGYREVGFDPHDHPHDRGEHALNPARTARESSWWLLGPMLALAVPSVAAGWPWTIAPLPRFTPVLERLFEYGEPAAATDFGSAHLFAGAASLLVAAIGVGLGVVYYSPWARWKLFDPSRAAVRYAPIHNFLVHRWYLDELYRAVLVRPTLALARGVAAFDVHILDAAVNAAARWTARLGGLAGGFDRRLVDGLVTAIAETVDALGRWGRALQTGRLRHYLMVLAFAAIGLFAGMFAWVLK